jgi:hypothetical protein
MDTQSAIEFALTVRPAGPADVRAPLGAADAAPRSGRG